MIRTIAMGALGLVACGDNRPAPVATTPVAVIPSAPGRALDVLLVIDDSTTTAALQARFAAAVPALLDELAATTGELPDLHVGAITTDVGTLGTDDATPGPDVGTAPGGCHGRGDAGAWQRVAAMHAAYVEDVRAADGSRTRNYDGALADVLAALAVRGSTGCGFEQPLHAAALALATPAAGFRRADAGLAIVVVTDEDDCSFAHATPFLDPAATTFGPLASFRCWRAGVTCDQPLDVAGAKTGCHPDDVPGGLAPLATLGAALRADAGDPRAVMLGVIGGAPAPIAVEPSGATLAIAAQCTTAGPDGLLAFDPAVRLPALATTFAHHVVTPACPDDLAPGQRRIARELRNVLGDPCLPDPIAEPDACVAVDQRADGTETPLARCPARGDCFTIVADPACGAAGLRLAVTRATAPPADTMVVVRCPDA